MLHFFSSIGIGEGSQGQCDLLVVDGNGRLSKGISDEVFIGGGGGGDLHLLQGVWAAVVILEAHADCCAILDFADPFAECSILRVERQEMRGSRGETRMLRGHWRLSGAYWSIKYDFSHCCRVFVMKLLHKLWCVHILCWFPAVMAFGITCPFHKVL